MIRTITFLFLLTTPFLAFTEHPKTPSPYCEYSVHLPTGIWCPKAELFLLPGPNPLRAYLRYTPTTQITGKITSHWQLIVKPIQSRPAPHCLKPKFEYDRLGRIHHISIQSKDAKTTYSWIQITYELQGCTITSHNGQIWQVAFTQGENPQITEIIAPDGACINYHYNEQNKPCSFTSPLGCRWQFHADKTTGQILEISRSSIEKQSESIAFYEYLKDSTIITFPTGRIRIFDHNSSLITNILDYNDYGELTQSQSFLFAEDDSLTRHTLKMEEENLVWDEQYSYSEGNLFQSSILTPGMDAPATTKFEWNKNGCLQSITKNNQIIQFRYNKENLLQTEKLEVEGECIQLTTYSYNKLGLPKAIQQKSSDNKNLTIIKYNSNSLPISKLCQNFDASVLQHTEFSYDARGRIVWHSHFNGLESLFSYDREGNITTIADLNTRIIHTYTYNSFGRLVSQEQTPSTGATKTLGNLWHWTHLLENRWLCFKQNYLSFSKYLSPCLGKGVYGEGELHSKLRISFINGIRNTRQNLLGVVQDLSTAHGDANIHYVYWRTCGTLGDIIRSTLSKFGMIWEETRLLAKMWKELIAEMGGANEGGIILHYAHSIGATETYNARHLMDPDELKMIRVITFGAPTLIPNCDFHSVTNLVSRRDGIALLDPIRYLMALIFSSEHIVFTGNHRDGLPIVDHYFDSYWSYWLKVLTDELSYALGSFS